jgi:hypothetical protein
MEFSELLYEVMVLKVLTYYLCLHVAHGYVCTLWKAGRRTSRCDFSDLFACNYDRLSTGIECVENLLSFKRGTGSLRNLIYLFGFVV